MVVRSSPGEEEQCGACNEGIDKLGRRMDNDVVEDSEENEVQEQTSRGEKLVNESWRETGADGRRKSSRSQIQIDQVSRAL